MTLRDQVLLASRQADQEQPSRLQTNRNIDCFHHTTRVIEILKSQGIDAAYIGKTAGEGQYHPPTAFPKSIGPYTITGVSHDAIWINASAQFDLIGGGNDGPDPLGTPGSPTANEIPAQYHRPNNPPVPHPISGVPSQPTPTPAMPSYEDLGGDAYWRAEIGVPLQADMAAAGQTLNDGSSVWFSRPIFQILRAYATGQAPDRAAIIKKTRNEWRSILGLPPLP